MPDQNHWLRLQLGSLQQAIDAVAFIEIFKNAIDALKAIDRQFSTFGGETLEWQIIEAGSSSPVFAKIIGAPQQNGSNGHSREVVSSFVDGVDQLNNSDTCPPHFNKAVLGYVRELARISRHHRLKPEIATPDRRVLVRKIVARNADWAIRTLELKKPRYTEYGSLEGRLKQISSTEQKRDKLVIIDSLDGHETLCYVGPELDSKVREAWKRRVVVTGAITVNRDSRRPTRIAVDDIRILQERSELPQMEDLHGIDITGGVESSEYIRRLRDDE